MQDYTNFKLKAAYAYFLRAILPLITDTSDSDIVRLSYGVFIINANVVFYAPDMIASQFDPLA